MLLKLIANLTSRGYGIVFRPSPAGIRVFISRNGVCTECPIKSFLDNGEFENVDEWPTCDVIEQLVADMENDLSV